MAQSPGGRSESGPGVSRCAAGTALVAAVTFFVLILGCPAQASGEVMKEAGERPKIGLALSGGGARGAMHIGILRVLEQLHFPIDYIAGTSMGSIIAGLYATGMSPDEIEQALTSIDRDHIFDDNPPRETRSFRANAMTTCMSILPVWDITMRT
jgi:NTE family protein